MQDWLKTIDLENRRLDAAEQRLEEKRSAIQESARELGRRQALKATRKIDRVFKPRRLNADDSKVIFHPVDFVVFNGMKLGPSIRNIILLDRQTRDVGHRAIQRSIERAIERENYEWQTLRESRQAEFRDGCRCLVLQTRCGRLLPREITTVSN